MNLIVGAPAEKDTGRNDGTYFAAGEFSERR